MATPVDPERFLEDCRAALRADKYVMDAVASKSPTAQVCDIASQQAMRKLLPVFQRYLPIERQARGIAGKTMATIAGNAAHGGVVAQTLANLTGASDLKITRSGLGLVALGALGLALGYLSGIWEFLLGGGVLLTIGSIIYATSEPEPQYPSLNFKAIRDLAKSGRASRQSAMAASQDDAWEASRGAGLQALNTLVSTTTKRHGAPAWIPFDAAYQIGSLKLPRGGFYVGRPGGSQHDAECAIDPKLEFTLTKPDWLGKGLSYWPRYANLTPEERGTFLAFLHSPRRAGGVAVGYVFLYIYGLEHRLLRDAAAGLVSSSEGRTIIDELVGLIEAYGGKSKSIGKYVGELLGVAFARFPEHVPSTPIAGMGWSTAQRVAFCSAAGRGPLTADWAFAWASSIVPAVNSATWSPMLPVVRDLFGQRYAACSLVSHRLSAPRSQVRINYRWAAFTGARIDQVPCDRPDYAGDLSQVIPYQVLLQSVCEDLESMRRMHRSEVPAGAALAAAPIEIARKAVTPKLASWAALELAAIRAKGTLKRRTQDVAAGLGWIGTAKFGKREATQLAQALQAMGIGMEPDPRFGGATPKPDTDLVLFELPVDAGRAPSATYSAAHLMVTAAASLGGVDGHASGELESAISGITAHFQLSPAEHARLTAVLASSVGQPVRPTATANKVKSLPEAKRHALAAVLVDIALADGHVSPAEIKLLERFYGALSLDPATLHADLHHGSLGAKKVPAPTVVPGAAPAAPPAFDADAIAKKLEETARVQSMLAEIFVDDTPVPSAAVPEPPSAGDDAVHLDALQLIAGRDTLDRAEWDAFCEPRDLMPDAALEALNEWSLERTGEVLLDGDDPLEVNTYARDQLAPPAADSTSA